VSDALAEQFGVGSDEMLTPAEVERRIRRVANDLWLWGQEHSKACDALRDAEKAWGIAEAESHLETARLSPELRAKDVDMVVRLACREKWERYIDAKSEEHKSRHRKQALERVLRAFENHEKFLERVVTR
jgi:hypothetical protein